MKTAKAGIGFIISATILFSLLALSEPELPQKRILTGERSGTAIIMTGAAARIPQQAALLEELYDRGLLKDVVFISGVSAGSLNAVILNGILSGKLTWDEYREILFNLNNKDIFIQREEMNKRDRKLPVDTEPVRNLLKKIV